MMQVRKGHINDLAALQQLAIDAILTVCQGDYDSEQRRVWATALQNKQRWVQILNGQLVFVAILDGAIAGFATLDKNCLDLLYVHKDYQRRGVARRLYATIEETATAAGARHLTADVSITAKPFFQKVGYRVLKKQEVRLQGVSLTNYKMEKVLV